MYLPLKGGEFYQNTIIAPYCTGLLDQLLPLCQWRLSQLPHTNDSVPLCLEGKIMVLRYCENVWTLGEHWNCPQMSLGGNADVARIGVEFVLKPRATRVRVGGHSTDGWTFHKPPSNTLWIQQPRVHTPKTTALLFLIQGSAVEQSLYCCSLKHS